MPYFEFFHIKQKRRPVPTFPKAEGKKPMVSTRRHLYAQRPASHMTGCLDARMLGQKTEGKQYCRLRIFICKPRETDCGVLLVVFELGTGPDKCCIPFESGLALRRRAHLVFK